MYKDAGAAWSDATTRLGLIPREVIIAGRSLGASVAVQLASEVNAAGLAIETPFSNIPDMAAHHYPWLPLRRLVRSRFDAVATVGQVHLPLLLIAARDDTIAPVWMAESVFAAANEPKEIAVVAGTHNNFDHYSSNEYTTLWREWLNSL